MYMINDFKKGVQFVSFKYLKIWTAIYEYICNYKDLIIMGIIFVSLVMNISLLNKLKLTIANIPPGIFL